jgi:hypothetical protein
MAVMRSFEVELKQTLCHCVYNSAMLYLSRIFNVLTVGFVFFLNF